MSFVFNFLVYVWILFYFGEGDSLCDGVHCILPDMCVPMSRVCDGTNDCFFNNDETKQSCLYKQFSQLTSGCTPISFICGNGTCIDRGRKCDHIVDCADGSDESDCGCNATQYKCTNGDCIDNSLKCDGKVDCADRSDEISIFCGDECSYMASAFECDNKVCVNASSKCNGHNECLDWSDEANCPCDTNPLSSVFLCNNKKCIPRKLTCNNKDDCDDFSDELLPTCHTCHFSHQCDNGLCTAYNSLCDGKNDCGDNSDEFKCETCHTNQYKCEFSNKCIPLSWRCNGVSDCVDGDDELYCACLNKTDFQCGTGECVPYHKLCNGLKDCIDGMDEDLCPNWTIPIKGRYGIGNIYDCHCNGTCHPGNGICIGQCDAGWTGPTCQIERIPVVSALQSSGSRSMPASESVDGNTTSCPPPAISIGNAWWEANITKSVLLRRFRVYNYKDTSLLEILVFTFTPYCTWNDDFREVGYMDVVCNVSAKSNHIVLLSSKDSRFNNPLIQICEFQIVVCSSYAFGKQCENTCNCRDPIGCDDVTGKCLGGCLDGWYGSACDRRSTKPEVTKQKLIKKQISSWNQSCHCSDGTDCSSHWCYKGCKENHAGIKCEMECYHHTNVECQKKFKCRCVNPSQCSLTRCIECENEYHSPECENKYTHLKDWQIGAAVGGGIGGFFILVALICYCLPSSSRKDESASRKRENDFESQSNGQVNRTVYVSTVDIKRCGSNVFSGFAISDGDLSDIQPARNYTVGRSQSSSKS